MASREPPWKSGRLRLSEALQVPSSASQSRPLRPAEALALLDGKYAEGDTVVVDAEDGGVDDEGQPLAGAILLR